MLLESRFVLSLTLLLGVGAASGCSGSQEDPVAAEDAPAPVVDAPVVPSDSSQDAGTDATFTCTAATDCPASADPCVVVACDAGECVSAPKPCDDGDECTADGCDTASGTCSHASLPGCGTACASDSDCEAAAALGLGVCRRPACVNGACIPLPLEDGASCAPAAAGPCVAGGRCLAGGCQPRPVVCTDGDACTTETCEPASGKCLPGGTLPGCGEACSNAAGCAALDAALGPCGVAACVGGVCKPLAAPAGTTCELPPLAGASCVDEGVCTPDGCQALAKDCEDGDLCTLDGCATSTGTCKHEPLAGCSAVCAVDADCEAKAFSLGACRVVSCQQGQCVMATAAEGTGCVSPVGGSCVAGGACAGGQCQPVFPVCPPGQTCFAGACACPASCVGLACGDDGCGGSCGGCADGQTCSEAGECVASCTPACGGKSCGSDGCGGECGVCGASEACTDAGTCSTPCTPSCQGKGCGPDGCGGTCGVCGAVEACATGGDCITPCAPQCGACGDDSCGGSCGICGADESCGTGACAAVCVPSCAGKACGDDGCGGSCGGCAADEACTASHHCIAPCVPDCTAKVCGDDGCGGTCGLCGAGDVCLAGPSCAVACVPSCAGKSCGPNGCGGDCGDCGAGNSCSPAGQCAPACLADCASRQCGDDGCGGTCGACDAKEQCTPLGQCKAVCVPKCTDKQCGGNGCGGQCGTCPSGTGCKTGKCLPGCTANCTGRDCGDDGCGGSCGTCKGTSCTLKGHCVTGCQPNCSGKACGKDGCGGICGSCGKTEACVEPGECHEACLPNCQGKTCGDNGCGGSCGPCAPGEVCGAFGACGPACVPSCEGKACGDDGCGGVCGTCAGDERCTPSYECALACVPACGGKVCGSNGCGGTCGSCSGQKVCVSGVCATNCSPNCGGKVCGPDGCGGSCGACGGQGVCDATGQCGCVPSCAGTLCGSNGCGGVCGGCPAGSACVAGQCESGCTPACAGRGCGADGCGGSCGDCGVAKTCTPAGQCLCVPSCGGRQCGDNGCGGSCGICASGNSCADGQCTGGCVPSCAGKGCGPDGCGGSCGSCAAGSGCAPSGQCQCLPTCAGKTCGDNGCGGTCGQCAAGTHCEAGVCAAGCTAQCVGKACGPDGCGASCGACSKGQTCSSAGACGCVPSCDGRSCGPNGCGGSCGSCPTDETCAQGQCVTGCAPKCAGKACGPDGCGGVCGLCDAGDQCGPAGSCGCAPTCGGKQCGGNGCGGSCGSCAGGNACTAGGQCACNPSCTGKECGTDGCGGTCGGCEGDLTCSATGQCACLPACGGKTCGDDGCGGKCGACSGAESCAPYGVCITACTNGCAKPSCAGKPGSPEACNALDDNCDGQVDEGCGGATCTGSEVPDDGIDSDCDGYEYFKSPTNKLKLLGAISDDAFDVPVAGLFHMGFLGEAAVTGTLSRAGKGQPVTWCVSGTTKPETGKVRLLSADVTACRLLDGTFQGTFTALLSFQTGVEEVTGTFGADPAEGMIVHAPRLHLDTRMRLDDVTITVAGTAASKPGDEGDEAADELTGSLTLGAGTGQVVLDVAGSYEGVDDVTLDALQHVGTAWTPYDTLALSLGDAHGTVTRTSGVWSVALGTSVDAVELAPGLSMTAATATIALTDVGSWEITLTGSAVAGPFSGVLTGTLGQSGAGLPVTGCLSGTVTGTVAGLTLTGLTITACLGQVPAISVGGQLSLGAGAAPFLGTLVLGPTWSLTLEVDSLSLAAGLPVLTDLTLTVLQGTTSFPLAARLGLVTANATLDLSVSGSWSPTGDIVLNLAKTGGGTWVPFPGLSLSFSSFTGTLSRKAGAWSVALSAAPPSVTLAPGFTLTAVTAAGTLKADGTWSLALSGTATNGGLSMALSGTLSQPAGGPVTGCLTGAASGTIVGLGAFTGTASVCLEAGVLKTVTLAGNLAFGTGQLSVTGALTISSPSVLTLTAATASMVPGLLTLNGLTFTKTIGGPAASLSATLVAGGLASGIGLSVSGTYASTGDLSLTIAKVGGAGWQPLVGLPFALDSLTGSLKRTAGLWSATITGSATATSLATAVTLTGVSASTTISATAPSSLTITGTAVAGPFSVKLTGTLTVPVGGGKLTGCLSGTVASKTVVGLALNNVTVTVCVLETGVSATIAGSATFEGKATTFAGTLTTAKPWTLTITVTGVTLLTGVVLDEVSLTLVEAGTTWTVSGKATVGSGGGALKLQFSGTYKTTGTVTLTVSLQAGTTWTPISGLTVTTLTGALTRTSGAWSVTVTSGGLTNVTFAGVTLSGLSVTGTYASPGAWSFSLTGTATVGLLGTVSLTGTVAQASPGAPVTGCLTGSASNVVIAGITLSGIKATVCSGTPSTVTFAALAKVDAKNFNVTGTATLGASPKLTFTVTTFPIATGVTLDTATFTLAGATASISGTLRLGSAPAEATVTVSGSYTSSANLSLTLALSPGTSWDPLGATTGSVTQATGTLTRTGTLATVSLSGNVGASLTLLPGFTLEDPSVGGTLDSLGAWKVSVSGTFTVDLGPVDFDVLLTATWSSDDTIEFTGTWTGDVQPFTGAIKDLITLSDLTVGVIVDPAAGEFTVTFGGTMEVCIFSPCTAGDLLSLTGEGGLVLGAGTTDLYFRADIAALELPLLGPLSNLSIVASSIDLPDFDAFGTPGLAADDRDTASGLSLLAKGPSPVQFGATNETLTYVISVSKSSLSLTAEFALKWRVFGPASNFPGISYFDVENMVLGGELKGVTPSLFISATAAMKPENQATALTGTVEFGLDIGLGTVAVEMTAFMNGRWLDCFGLERFAIQNPALTLTVTIAPPPAIPVPTALGFNVDMFWLKSATNWPSETSWPVPITYPAPNAPPASVAQLGGTFYFNTVPSPSGLCVFGICPSLPPFLIRLDVFNLEFPGDFVNIANDLALAVIEFLPGEGPSALLPHIDTSPLSIEFNQLSLYASTHHLDEFGIDWKPGFLLELDLTVATTDVMLSGFADTKGITLEGSIEPINLLGLDLITFIGDPFRRYASLGAAETGTVSVPDAAPLDITTGTVEGFIRDNVIGATPLAATLADKLDASNGYAIGIGSLTDGKGKVTVHVKKAGELQIITTDGAPISQGILHHVAVTFSGTKVGIFVDGVRQKATASGPVVGIGASTAALTLGRGASRIDDVRVWSVVRSRADIRGESKFLDWTYINEPTLVARYEFDFDSDGTTSAYNSRYRSTGARLHGTYGGGASAVRNVADNDLNFKLALRVPGSGGSEGGPAFSVQAGVALDIPILGEIETGLKVLIGGGHAEGSFYTPEFVLLPVGFGQFRVGGNGPNLVSGDFDDGLFASVDLVDLNFAATGGLAFTTNKGARVMGVDASVSFACAPGAPCDGLFDHVLQVAADIDLTVDLGALLGDIGIEGQASAKLNSANWYIEVNGTLVVFGLNLISGTVRIDGVGITLSTSIDLPDVFGIHLGSIGLDVTFSYSPLQLCATGGYTSPANENDAKKDIGCGVTFCLGGPSPIQVQLNCDPFCLSSGMCESGQCSCAICEDTGKQAGASCRADGECDTYLKCSAIDCFTGTCVCQEDEACLPSQWCDAGTDLNKNSCQPDRAECGDCDRDAKCLSGNCSSAVLGKCITEASLELDESCCQDDQCIRGGCGTFSRACVCNDDLNCENDPGYGSDFFCKDNGALSDASCEAKHSNGYSICTRDGQCKSDLCSSCGVCRASGQVEYATCYSDDMCESGYCKHDSSISCTIGECRYKCDDDNDCENGEYCAANGLNPSTCEALHTNGSDFFCTTGGQCRSGFCSSCGVCRATGLSNGKTCYVDGMCTSDRCDHFSIGLCTEGVCACNDNDDCESYEHCDSGDCLDDVTVHGQCNEDTDCVLGNCACPTLGGHCHATTGARVIGADCYDDDECESGRCGSSTHSNCDLATCECANDGDCNASEHCETGTCEDDHEDHDNCDEDSDCESGICDCGLVYGKCVRHDNSRSVGATCYVNSECVSDSCSIVACDIGGGLGVCKCKEEGDCVVEKYCNRDTLDHPFEDNLCYTEKSNGSSCEEDFECLSSCCNYNWLGSECAVSSKCN